MRSAPYTNPAMPPPTTGIAFKRIFLTLLVLLLLAVALVVAVITFRGKAAVKAGGEKPAPAPWKSQSVYPPLEEKAAAVAAPPPREDGSAARLLTIETQQQSILAALEELRRSKLPVAGATPVKPAPKPPEKPRSPGAPFYLANTLEKAGPVSGGAPTYTLAPGSTKIPCLLETRVVSSVEGYFTCRVSTNIYDTATGRHLLIPQGSTVLGSDQANALVYGSERLDTVSLSLSLPDGRTVDLGRAPLTDQQGVAGLGGKVENHYLQLFGAVFIGGVLKGGSTAITTALAGQAGAGQVATGVTSDGAQATTKVVQPYINIKPTITAEAGQLATVLLIKKLELPAMWAGGGKP